MGWKRPGQRLGGPDRGEGGGQQLQGRPGVQVGDCGHVNAQELKERASIHPRLEKLGGGGEAGGLALGSPRRVEIVATKLASTLEKALGVQLAMPNRAAFCHG